MNISRLIIREILYRKVNFLLAVLAVVFAVGCLVADLTVLGAHDVATAKILSDKELETKARVEKRQAEMKKLMQKLTDDYRKITKKLGFNILILPKSQDLWNLKTLGYVTETMPQENSKKLADSEIVTINHLLPMVQEMVTWKEKGKKVLLTGTRGEVPLKRRDPKKPIVYPVPPGSAALGYQLHKQLKLKKGDKIQFQGKEFTVHKLHKKRGTLDDITIWISLAEAQELLNRKGKINLIMALECNCNVGDPDERLAQIYSEVQKILPDTQVEELTSIASARAALRTRAVKEAKAGISREKKKAEEDLREARSARDTIRAQLWSFASLLIPLVLLGAIVWLGLMTLSNVNQRQTEIGILRALGLSSGAVFILFISRAVVVGLLGAIIGYGMGMGAGLWLAPNEVADTAGATLFSPVLLLVVLVAAPLVCALVGWMSAMLAARQDPAVILQHA